MPFTDKGYRLARHAVAEYTAIADLLRQAEFRLETLDGRLDGMHLNRNRRTGVKIAEAERACREMSASLARELEESDAEVAEESC